MFTTQFGGVLDGLKIDFDDVIMYSHDQIYNTYPAVFPTVMFNLKDTDDMLAAAEEVVENPSQFLIGINGLPDRKVDNCITVISGDGEQASIPLTEAEQSRVWAILDAQCREVLGKGCETLLEESRAQMKEE